MTALITGNTHPVRDRIKALGGVWDPDGKGWRVPEAKAEEARRIVADAPLSALKNVRRGPQGEGLAVFNFLRSFGTYGTRD